MEKVKKIKKCWDCGKVIISYDKSVYCGYCREKNDVKKRRIGIKLKEIKEKLKKEI